MLRPLCVSLKAIPETGKNWRSKGFISRSKFGPARVPRARSVSERSAAFHIEKDLYFAAIPVSRHVRLSADDARYRHSFFDFGQQHVAWCAWMARDPAAAAVSAESASVIHYAVAALQ